MRKFQPGDKVRRTWISPNLIVGRIYTVKGHPYREGEIQGIEYIFLVEQGGAYNESNFDLVSRPTQQKKGFGAFIRRIET